MPSSSEINPTRKCTGMYSGVFLYYKNYSSSLYNVKWNGDFSLVLEMCPQTTNTYLDSSNISGSDHPRQLQFLANIYLKIFLLSMICQALCSGDMVLQVGGDYKYIHK